MNAPTPTTRYEIRRLLALLQRDIHDDFRASDEPDDDTPGMQVTIACDDDINRFVFQTGDNSFSGACYGRRNWAVISLYRDSELDALVEDVISQLEEAIAQSAD